MKIDPNFENISKKIFKFWPKFRFSKIIAFLLRFWCLNSKLRFHQGSFFTIFSNIFPTIMSFPLRFWKITEIHNFDEKAPNFLKNCRFPLWFWLSFENPENQQNLSGNAIISHWKSSKSCVMTHRFVRFFQFFKKVSNCTQIQEQGQIQGKFDENYPWGCK